MDITPGIKVACMGGFGYLFGIIAKTNPKTAAITWAVAETAIQLFKQLDAFDRNRLENPSRIVVGGITCVYLHDQHLITKTIQAIVSLAVFCLLPDIMARLNIKFQINSR